jgi:hypothetical protein
MRTMEAHATPGTFVGPRRAPSRGVRHIGEIMPLVMARYASSTLPDETRELSDATSPDSYQVCVAPSAGRVALQPLIVD